VGGQWRRGVRASKTGGDYLADPEAADGGAAIGKLHCPPLSEGGLVAPRPLRGMNSLLLTLPPNASAKNHPMSMLPFRLTSGMTRNAKSCRRDI
jgi:hypothetical protein